MGRKYNRSSEADIILEKLARIPMSSRYVTVNEIIRSLDEAGIQFGLRSVQRYLKQMYESGRYGIVRNEWDTAYRYRRERSTSQFDSIQLKLNECLLLRLALEHMKYQLPGSVLKSLNFLFDKAENLLNEKGGDSKEQEWLKKVCVVSSAISQLPAKVLPRIFDAVSEALYKGLKLNIEYTNSEEKNSKTPLGLVQQDNRLSLLCQFENFDDFVHLALHRFKKASVSAFPVNRPESFDLARYVNDRHSNDNNGGWIKRILEFERDAADRNLEETHLTRLKPFGKRTGEVGA